MQSTVLERQKKTLILISFNVEQKEKEILNLLINLTVFGERWKKVTYMWFFGEREQTHLAVQPGITRIPWCACCAESSGGAISKPLYWAARSAQTWPARFPPRRCSRCICCFWNSTKINMKYSCFFSDNIHLFWIYFSCTSHSQEGY